MGAKNYHNLEYVFSRLACPFFIRVDSNGRAAQTMARDGMGTHTWQTLAERLSLGGLLAAKQRMHWKTFVLRQERKECSIHPRNVGATEKGGRPAMAQQYINWIGKKCNWECGMCGLPYPCNCCLCLRRIRFEKVHTLTLEEWKREKWEKRTTQKNRTK